MTLPANVLPGDPLRADHFNGILERLGALSADAGFGLGREPGGSIGRVEILPWIQPCFVIDRTMPADPLEQTFNTIRYKVRIAGAGGDSSRPLYDVDGTNRYCPFAIAIQDEMLMEPAPVWDPILPNWRAQGLAFIPQLAGYRHEPSMVWLWGESIRRARCERET